MYASVEDTFRHFVTGLQVAMFSGIVETMGTVVGLDRVPPGCRLTIRSGPSAEGVAVGSSVAVNGCCLTVVAVRGENLERSLRMGGPLDGHFVTGHVDAVGAIVDRRDEGEWSFFWFGAPRELTRQMASKASVSVDGVSLTLVDVEDDRFSVALVPHTLQATTLGRLAVGAKVNIETDILAKYVSRLVEGRRSAPSPPKVPPSK
jgi:riboflavin synthase